MAVPTDPLLQEIWADFRSISSEWLLDDLVHDESLERRWVQEGSEPGVSFRHFVRHFYIPDRWQAFERNFFSSAATEGGNLLVFRCLEHPKPDKLLGQILHRPKSTGYRGHLGIYWSWSSASAGCFWGTRMLGQLHLGGLVEPSAINVAATVKANFHPSVGVEEREIQLHDGAQVVLVEGCVRKNLDVPLDGMPCRPIERVARKA